MAYGTPDGLALNFKDWAQLTDPDSVPPGPFTATVIAAARTKADALVNAKLAMTYDVSLLPITTPTMAVDIINTISDDLTSYYLARSRYTEEDPNTNAWVEELKTEALAQLNYLVESNLILQGESPISAGNDARDPIFGMQTTASGDDTLDYTKTSMDEIQQVTYAG